MLCQDVKKKGECKAMQARDVFFIDYDGSLADSGDIDVKLFAELVEMMSQPNFDLVLCSGRPAPYLQGVRSFFGNKVKTPYIIAENGSVVVVRKGHRFYFEMLVPWDERQAIFKIKEDLRKIQQRNNYDFVVEYGKDYSISVHWGRSFEKEAFWEYFNGNIESWIGAQRLKKIRFVPTSDCIDIFGNSISKATGVKHVLQHYAPKDLGRIFYVGDSANDIKAAQVVKTMGGKILAPENVSSDFQPFVDIVGKGRTLSGVIDAIKTAI